jgi:hypothetical protein
MQLNRASQKVSAIKKLILSLFLCVLTLVGLLLLGIFVLRMPSLGWLGEAHKTTGIVVGITNLAESGESFQVPRVQFSTENGQQISVDMICPPFDCFSDYNIGSKVSLIYQSNYPEFAIADTAMGRLWTPLFFFVIGLMFTLSGPVYLAKLISERRKSSSRFMNPLDRA